jgi:hypothetical protein
MRTSSTSSGMAMNKFRLNKGNARFLRPGKGVKEVSVFRAYQAGWLFRNRNTATGVEKK